MRISFYGNDIPVGDSPLDKISSKYINEYYENGGTSALDRETGIHHFGLRWKRN